MKKIVLFSFLVSALFSSNILAVTKNIDLNVKTLRERLAHMSGAKNDKQQQNKSQKLKQILKENFSNIKNPQEKFSVAKLLKNLNELNKKRDDINREEKILTRRTILNTISNLTSITAIKCATIITVLYQVRGIITSQDLKVIIEDLGSITKTVSWGGGAVGLVLVVTSILKVFTAQS